MTNTLTRDVLIITAISIGSVLAFNNRATIYAHLGLTSPSKAQLEDTKNASTASKPINKASSSIGANVTSKGSQVTIPKSRDGQFWTQARVNYGRINFLVDTGASMVALTKDDARKSGIRMHELEYTLPISTAGGLNHAARVELKSITIGGITMRDVEGIVVKEGLETSLLGMTFLGRLQKMEATQNALILRR